MRKIVIFLSLIFLLPCLAICEPQEDQEWKFDLAPKSSSETYKRPEKAEYFWWDTDSSVQVELTFDDGKKETAPSEKNFSKKIISVKFINPGEKSYPVTVWARF